jgi:hypothetical protein
MEEAAHLSRDAADRLPKDTEAQRMSMEEDEDSVRLHLVAYRLMADSAERTQDRRQLANSFFITANLAIGAVYTFLVHTEQHRLLIPAAAVGVAVCGLWAATLWYYRALLAAKFRLLGEFERAHGIAGYEREWEIFSVRHPFGLAWLSLAFIEMVFAVGTAGAHVCAAIFLQHVHMAGA